jgi:FkbM family methyltransferase
MISYAQNGEDVVLQRAFSNVDDGFYVDVGACVPVDDSVTLHFYERGWSGVNVEPDPVYYAELAQARTRDVNLNVAIGSGSGAATFYPSDVRGQGTLDPQAAARQSERPPIEVEQLPLGSVLAKYTPARGVDFLKVDVEGWEAEVLASTDWTDARPRVVVVEAVDPGGRPTHEEWEGLLLSAGYRFALFDGLNRFYCRDEDADRLLPRLAAPANPLDNWRRALEADLATTLEAERATHAATRAALETEHAAHAETRSVLEAEHVAHTETVASLHASLEAERAGHAEARRLLEVVLTSTSWRMTAPLRNVSRRVKEHVPRPRATTFRRRRTRVLYPDAAPVTSSDPAAVLEVTGVSADEILRRCTGLRAARETSWQD